MGASLELFWFKVKCSFILIHVVLELDTKVAEPRVDFLDSLLFLLVKVESNSFTVLDHPFH